MLVYNDKRFAVIWLDHAVGFDVIMTLLIAFFNNLRLKHLGLFQFENNQFYLVAIRPNSWENTKSCGSHRLFTLSDTVFNG